MCVCASHEYKSFGGQKRTLEIPELELLRVVSDHIDAGN